MVFSLKTCAAAIAISLVGLSSTGWDMAHAVAHGHEAEHRDGTGHDGGNSVENEDLPGGHYHPQLSRVFAGKGAISLGKTTTPLASDGFQMSELFVIRMTTCPSTLPRPGPRQVSTSLPRAPPIA